METEHFTLALKVLTRWMDGQRPSSEDYQRLQSCVPELAHLPPDSLACAVVREHERRLWRESPDRQPFPPVAH